VPEAYGWAGTVPYERNVIRVPSLAGTVPGDREPWGLYMPEDGRILLREDDGTVLWSGGFSEQDVYIHELGHACLDDWLRAERGPVLGVVACRELDEGPGLLVAAFGPGDLRSAAEEYESLRSSGKTDAWYGNTTDVSTFGEWFAESFRGHLLDEPVPPAMGRLLDSIEDSRVP